MKTLLEWGALIGAAFFFVACIAFYLAVLVMPVLAVWVLAHFAMKYW